MLSVTFGHATARRGGVAATLGGLRGGPEWRLAMSWFSWLFSGIWGFLFGTVLGWNLHVLLRG
jgi:hypothetical protein